MITRNYDDDKNSRRNYLQTPPYLIDIEQPKLAIGKSASRNITRSLYLILEAFPAVTVPPFSLKLGRSFLSFAGSN